MSALLPYQQRVVDEKAALDAKIMKLADFIVQTAAYKSLGSAEKDCLTRQHTAMRAYSGVLRERIEAFKTEKEASFIIGEFYFTAGDGFVGSESRAPRIDDAWDISPPMPLDRVTICTIVFDNGHISIGYSINPLEAPAPDPEQKEAARVNAIDNAVRMGVLVRA